MVGRDGRASRVGVGFRCRWAVAVAGGRLCSWSLLLALWLREERHVTHCDIEIIFITQEITCRIFHVTITPGIFIGPMEFRRPFHGIYVSPAEPPRTEPGIIRQIQEK